MEKFKFTEGEWFIEKERERNEYGSIGIDISTIGEKEFATIWSFGDLDEESDYTAKLISAAPNLLKALIDITELVDTLPEEGSLITAIENAKKAIDKALKY